VGSPCSLDIADGKALRILFQPGQDPVKRLSSAARPGRTRVATCTPTHGTRLLNSIQILCLVFDIVGLSVGAWLALRALPARGPWRLTRDLWWLTLFGGSLVLLSYALGVAAFQSRFAIMRLWAHALFLVFTPVLLLRAFACLQEADKRAKAFAILLTISGLLSMGVYVHAFYLEPYDLQVRHYEYRSKRLNGIAQPIKVMVLADFQTEGIGAYEERVFARMDEEKVDLVLFPGDWIQLDPWDQERFQEERDKLVALFANLKHKPRYGFFAVDGDVETAREVLAGTEVRILEDELARLPAESQLQIFGLVRSSSREAPGPNCAWDTEYYLARQGFKGLTILLGHSPDFTRGFLGGISHEVLAVAGHTHGGQVVVPFFGPPITLSALPRSIAAGGMHRMGEATLCLSRGVGLERGKAPRLRFLCPPELVVLTLRGE
jgi:uncharacterized protein